MVKLFNKGSREIMLKNGVKFAPESVIDLNNDEASILKKLYPKEIIEFADKGATADFKKQIKELEAENEKLKKQIESLENENLLFEEKFEALNKKSA